MTNSIVVLAHSTTVLDEILHHFYGLLDLRFIYPLVFHNLRDFYADPVRNQV